MSVARAVLSSWSRCRPSRRWRSPRSRSFTCVAGAGCGCRAAGSAPRQRASARCSSRSPPPSTRSPAFCSARTWCSTSFAPGGRAAAPPSGRAGARAPRRSAAHGGARRAGPVPRLDRGSLRAPRGGAPARRTGRDCRRHLGVAYSGEPMMSRCAHQPGTSSSTHACSAQLCCSGGRWCAGRHAAMARWTMRVPVVRDLVATALSAVLGFSERPLYPAYSSVPRLFGVSGLGDQATAGVLMWVFVSTSLLGAAVIVARQLVDPSPLKESSLSQA